MGETGERRWVWEGGVLRDARKSLPVEGTHTRRGGKAGGCQGRSA